MKILCDFDGVLTDISEEAHRAKEIFTQTLLQNNCLNPGRVAAMLSRGEEQLQKNPHQYGWRNRGRIAAYANEDSFLANMGLSYSLDDLSQTEDGDFFKMRQDLKERNIASFNQVSMDSYQTMTEETKRNQRNPIDPDAVKFLNDVMGRGHRVTVVSNSSAERVIDLLSRQGLKAADRKKNSQCPLGVCGGAAKFELDNASRGFFVGPYWIDTARPKYEKILWDENPAIVIGDVFSLDLGLPLFLAKREPECFGKIKLYLRERLYTPDWVKTFITLGSGKQNLKLLRHLGEMDI